MLLSSKTDFLIPITISPFIPIIKSSKFTLSQIFKKTKMKLFCIIWDIRKLLNMNLIYILCLTAILLIRIFHNKYVSKL